MVSSFVNRLPDEDAGEVPFAYVVRAKGSSLQERDVIEFVAPQVLYRVAIVVFYVIFCVPNHGKMIELMGSHFFSLWVTFRLLHTRRCER